jgi:hypothetical protein
MSAPAKTVSLLGHDVPLYDDMLFGEKKDLQRAQLRWAREGTGALEQNLDAARIILHYRLGAQLPAFDERKPFPFGEEALDAAVTELIAPFLEAQARMIRQRRVQLIAARSPAFTAELNQADAELANGSESSVSEKS